MMNKSEIEFGKLGFRRYENKDIIVYYIPYNIEDIRYNDITFLKKQKKVVFYQGSNLGSDAYRADFKIIKAVMLQLEELGGDI